ncbi:hypothetical protein OHO28_09320 [Streptomyces europaeiscabiei]|uniref:hypothetical protein n=1 Tax=Streptomyces europaeiscabiei TaxID=146819 RepID=UPI002E185D3D
MSNEAGQAQQLLQISRLYRVANDVPSSPTEAIAGMENTFGIWMAVANLATGVLVFPGALAPSPETVQEMCRPGREQDVLGSRSELGTAS